MSCDRNSRLLRSQTTRFVVAGFCEDSGMVWASLLRPSGKAWKSSMTIVNSKA
ncbi:unnamed protein product [Durusdinium trenchii]|uniref:Uncharacterized protein n=1 Tax=Durusdinium trenchii TaxID=1381693 RepID=A0ABP0HQB4_9DINO